MKIILAISGVVAAFIGGAATNIYNDIRPFILGQEEYIAKSKQVDSSTESGYVIIDQEWKLNFNEHNVYGEFSIPGGTWDVVGYERAGRVSLAYQGTLETSSGIGNYFLTRNSSNNNVMKGHMVALDCDGEVRTIVKCPIIIARKEFSQLVDLNSKNYQHLISNNCELLSKTNQACR